MSAVPAANDQEKGPDPYVGRRLNLNDLALEKAPPKHWWRPHWLGSGVTLLAGSGGTGKSALMQYEATTGAAGLAYFTDACEPYRSLVWNCEDEHDDMWRRQERICDHLGVPISTGGGAMGHLQLESRVGCENALMATVQGSVLSSTSLFKYLRECVNDLAIDVAWLDNVAHVFLGDHDNRTHVTTFVNELNGMVRGRPFAVVLGAHVSRAKDSEYTGSVAWENAARMRWYLGRRLPDERPEPDGASADDVRYLCKRKSNYSALDHVRFRMREGILVPDQAVSHVGGIVAAIDERKAEEVCLSAFRRLSEMGIGPTDGKNSPDYLPTQIASKGLADGFNKSELTRAMNRLMTSGTFTRGPIGHYANRNPRHGLVLQGAR